MEKRKDLKLTSKEKTRGGGCGGGGGGWDETGEGKAMATPSLRVWDTIDVIYDTTTDPVAPTNTSQPMLPLHHDPPRRNCYTYTIRIHQTVESTHTAEITRKVDSHGPQTSSRWGLSPPPTTPRLGAFHGRLLPPPHLSLILLR
uniref:Uncharacterized protein n=1 Tax=Oryza glumipatula TaxID=40148 RepID=A0A0D9Z2V8_9ORYZ